MVFTIETVDVVGGTLIVLGHGLCGQALMHVN